MVEKPEISPICGKNSAHAEIRVHKICVFLGRTVHTHGKITGWGKLLKKKPTPFRITKRVSELFRKNENAVVPFRKRGFEVKYPEQVTVKSNCIRRLYGKRDAEDEKLYCFTIVFL